MAALGWLMNLGFAGGVESTAVPGPYLVEAVDVFVPGVVAGEAFRAGSVAGEVYRPGAVAGQISGGGDDAST